MQQDPQLPWNPAALSWDGPVIRPDADAGALQAMWKGRALVNWLTLTKSERGDSKGTVGGGGPSSGYRRTVLLGRA